MRGLLGSVLLLMELMVAVTGENSTPRGLVMTGVEMRVGAKDACFFCDDFFFCDDCALGWMIGAVVTGGDVIVGVAFFFLADCRAG